MAVMNAEVSYTEEHPGTRQLPDARNQTDSSRKKITSKHHRHCKTLGDFESSALPMTTKYTYISTPESLPFTPLTYFAKVIAAGS